MKNVLALLFVLMGWQALAGDGAWAGSAADTHVQQNARASDAPAHHHASDGKDHATSPAKLPVPKRTKKFPNIHERSTTANAVSPRQSIPSLSNRAAGSAPAGGQTGGKGHSLQPTAANRNSVSFTNNVRHRSSNPATIGGAARLPSGNSGSLDGTRMSRKP